MNLNELKDSLRDKSEEELKKLFLDSRQNRRVVKQSTIDRAEKAKKAGVSTKANTRQALGALTSEQAALLLRQITGG